MYHQQQFGDLLILADALEEAGCSDFYVLQHCRNKAPHVLGCWVIDSLLGKPAEISNCEKRNSIAKALTMTMNTLGLSSADQMEVLKPLFEEDDIRQEPNA